MLKVYISESSNPAAVAAAGSAGCLLSVDFQPRGFTLTLGGGMEELDVSEHEVPSELRLDYKSNNWLIVVNNVNNG